jgi:hypothetical protein
MVLSGSVALCMVLCHVGPECFLTAHLGGNDLVVRRDVREKNIFTLRASRVTHDTRNSCFKGVEIYSFCV